MKIANFMQEKVMILYKMYSYTENEIKKGQAAPGPFFILSYI